MAEFILETNINAPKDRCFDLSRSIDLHTISTDHTAERAIAGRTAGLIALGETVTWSAVHFGVRQQLESRITAYHYPDSFRDEMVRGAFAYIKHDHLFRFEHGYTVMTDIFRFASPMGLVGRIVDRVIMTGYLRALLERRNKVIKDYAETDKWKQVLKG
ncbi:MAG: SRPBCC family protein [Bacteroidetes bacterium]|nr:SRPBCC family protein [Bacteroidota bacterium]